MEVLGVRPAIRSAEVSSDQGNKKMALENSQMEIVGSLKSNCCKLPYLVGGLFCGVALTIMLGAAFWIGRQSVTDLAEQTSWKGIPRDRVLPLGVRSVDNANIVRFGDEDPWWHYSRELFSTTDMVRSSIANLFRNE